MTRRRVNWSVQHTRAVPTSSRCSLRLCSRFAAGEALDANLCRRGRRRTSARFMTCAAPCESGKGVAIWTLVARKSRAWTGGHESGAIATWVARPARSQGVMSTSPPIRVRVAPAPKVRSGWLPRAAARSSKVPGHGPRHARRPGCRRRRRTSQAPGSCLSAPDRSSQGQSARWGTPSGFFLAPSGGCPIEGLSGAGPPRDCPDAERPLRS